MHLTALAMLIFRSIETLLFQERGRHCELYFLCHVKFPSKEKNEKETAQIIIHGCHLFLTSTILFNCIGKKKNTSLKKTL
jgi:hypothetical protein